MATPVESLLEETGALGDEEARGKTREILRAVLDLHQAALSRALDIARAQGATGSAVVDAFAADDLVGHVLALHGLHPVSLEARVRRAFARDGASLRAQGGSAEVMAVEGGVIHVRARRGRASEASMAATIRDLVDTCAADADDTVIVWEQDGRPEAHPALTQIRTKPRRSPAPEEDADACELCGAAIAAQHDHIAASGGRDVRCSCSACAMLFDGRGESTANGTHSWKRVPSRRERMADFRMSDGQWDALGVPIGLAFFYVSGPSTEVLALYPGPAGAVESRPHGEAWSSLVMDNPVLRDLAPDVEALLVNRVRGARAYYRVSIDVCFELVGRLRRHWRGFTGGPEAWSELGEFLGGLAEETGRARA